MPRTVTTGLALVTLDVTGLVSYGPAFRYALIFGVLALSVMLDVHHTRRRGGGITTVPFILLAAWLVSLWASALGAAQWQPNTLVVIVTFLMIGLGAANMWLPGRSATADLPPDAPTRFSRWDTLAYWMAAIFAIVAIVDAATGVPGNPVNLLGHERAFVAIYLLCLPRRRHSWIVRVLVALAMVIALVQYPAATTALALLLAAAVAVIVRRTAYPIGLTFLATTTAGMLIVTGAASALLASFYEVSGRIDNTHTRTYLWNQALEVVRQSPVEGGATRVSITYLANISGRITYVPTHNSYLTVMVVGGIVAAVLLIAGLVMLIIGGLSRSLEERRALGSQWIPTLVAVSMTMYVNPVVDKFGDSVFLLAVIMVGLASLTRSTESHPDG